MDLVALAIAGVAGAADGAVDGDGPRGRDRASTGDWQICRRPRLVRRYGSAKVVGFQADDALR